MTGDSYIGPPSCMVICKGPRSAIGVNTPRQYRVSWAALRDAKTSGPSSSSPPASTPIRFARNGGARGEPAPMVRKRSDRRRRSGRRRRHPTVPPPRAGVREFDTARGRHRGGRTVWFKGRAPGCRFPTMRRYRLRGRHALAEELSNGRAPPLRRIARPTTHQ